MLSLTPSHILLPPPLKRPRQSFSKGTHRRRNHCQLNVSPLLLRHKLLHQLQFMQITPRPGLRILDLASRDDRIARHDLAIPLNQANNVRMVQPEHTGLGILQAGRALELIPKQAPEPCPVELAARHALETQVQLSLHNLSDGLFLDGGKARLFLRKALVTNGGADVQQLLWSEQRAHMLGPERRCSVKLRRRHACDLVSGIKEKMGSTNEKSVDYVSGRRKNSIQAGPSQIHIGARFVGNSGRMLAASPQLLRPMKATSQSPTGHSSDKSHGHHGIYHDHGV